MARRIITQIRLGFNNPTGDNAALMTMEQYLAQERLCDFYRRLQVELTRKVVLNSLNHDTGLYHRNTAPRPAALYTAMAWM